MDPPFDFTVDYLQKHTNATKDEIRLAYQQEQQASSPRRQSIGLDDPERIRSLQSEFGYTPRLGGLGGTVMQGTERGVGYEGVNLEDETVCKREGTIRKLLDRLSERHILLIRSPPMVGKTALAQLLEHYLLNSDEGHDKRVLRISLLWMSAGKGSKEFLFEDEFKKLMCVSWTDFLSECSRIQTILIVDEIQKIYKPGGENTKPANGGEVFWDTFKAAQQYKLLQIVAFASYGYRGAYDSDGCGQIVNISPYQLDKENTWGIEEMKFTREEFNEYFQKFSQYHHFSLSPEDARSLSNYVYEATACHPGLVAYVMNRILERFSAQIKQGTERMTFVKVFQFLKSYSFHSSLLDVRAAPRLTSMTDEEKKLADFILFHPKPIRSNNIPNHGRLIKTNFLVDIQKDRNEQVLDFAAPLLRAIYLHYRLGSTTHAPLPPEDFHDFLIKVFAAMNPTVLRKSLGIGTDGRLLERVWQMEWYRAATQILPENIHASVDVGAVFGSCGYIDFYVDDNRNWAIELLRDGEKGEEHLKRFLAGGTYSTIMDYVTEYAIIDIRQNQKSSPPLKQKQNFVYAMCNENFESVKLLFPDGKEQYVRLLGSSDMMLKLGIDVSELTNISAGMKH